jgi:segregation and condensation protein B
MLETLAIVAYRQPITRPEIDDIRGVDSASTLRVLLERNLLRIVGKKEEPGRPVLYGTTKFFLEFFQLRDLKDLPSLKEFTELSEEHAKQVEIRFGEGAAEAAMREFETSRPIAAEAASEIGMESEQRPRGDRSIVVDVSQVQSVRMAPEVARPKMREPDDGEFLEEEEDAALEAIDRAVSRADSVLRTYRKTSEPAPAVNESIDADDVDPTEEL